MSRRRRQLSPDEQALWRKVAGTARPLAGRVTDWRDPAPSVRPETARVKPAPVQQPSRDRNASESKSQSTSAGLERRTARALSRGRVRIEARLDLHGMTQDTAYLALQGFLMRARASHSRYVLVITGKSGVLNRLVPIWLAEPHFRTHVSGSTTAAPRHGGHGALYVRLRRL